MKTYIKKISLLLLTVVIAFTSCETEESFEITSPEAEFTLKTPGITSIFLNFALPENPAFTITWEDEVTGVSSYDIEMATDPEFTAPMNLGSTNEKSFSMTVTDFNNVLKDVGVTSYEDTAVYFRIKAGGITSNSILMLVTTYAVEIPLITDPGIDSSITLSDIDPEAEAMTITWDDPEIGENSTATVNYDVQIAKAGTDFDPYISLGTTQELSLSVTHAALNDAILTMDGVANEEASYDLRIVATVETSSGDLIRTSDATTVGITPYETVLPDPLYVVGAGAADAGWSWDSPVELKLNGAVYSGNIRLTPDNGGNFRFFTDSSLQWDSPSYNYTYYEVRGYTFDPNLVNAEDGDSNFKFIGTEGEYSIRIDTSNKTITLGDPITDAFEVASWGVVGSGYNNWGAFADAPFYTTSENNVLVSYVNLVDGEIKFRENNEWVNDFGDNGNDGTLDSGGSNIPVSAGDYKITLNLNDNTYSIEEFSWGVVGSGYNNWGADGPDAKFYYDHKSDTFKVGVRLVDGEIKFRMNNEWVTDFGDNGNDGTLDGGGANIGVSEGHYLITINFNDNTYSIQPYDVWGIVGSGYNDWGATPDYSLTEVNPGVWVGSGVPLIDGEIKFRLNNEWVTDFGDNDTDGTLDGGGSNIPVSAGNYIVTMDLNSNTYSLGQR